MRFFQLAQYREFERMLQVSIERGVNVLIVGVRGVGMSYFVKRFLEHNEDLEVRQIVSQGERLGVYNLLDLGIGMKEGAIADADEMMQRAGVEEKFGIIVENPGYLSHDQFKNSYVAHHVYDTYYFPLGSWETMEEMMVRVNKSLSKMDRERIYELVGGYGRLAKYMAVNWKKGEGVIVASGEWKEIFGRLVGILAECEKDVMEKMGAVVGGRWQGKLVEEYFVAHPVRMKVQVKVSDDLRLWEGGEEGLERLTVPERDVVRLLAGGGVVGKEMIAEVRWGEGSYDKYSDEAVAKAMMRLRRKFVKHRLVTVPRVGYRLERL